MEIAITTLALAALAVALFRPARHYGRRLLVEPRRPEFRAAAIINAFLLAAVFGAIIVAGLGAAGIPAALAGMVLGAELSFLVSYMVVHLAFGDERPAA